MDIQKKEKLIFKDYLDNLSPQEKKKLFTVFEEHGLPYRRAYRKMCFYGFKAWEIDGVYNLLKEYGIDLPDHRSDFWNELDNKETFYHFMGDKGMSRVTTHRRFLRFSFSRWETVGIKEILRIFENRKKKKRNENK